MLLKKPPDNPAPSSPMPVVIKFGEGACDVVYADCMVGTITEQVRHETNLLKGNACRQVRLL